VLRPSLSDPGHLEGGLVMRHHRVDLSMTGRSTSSPVWTASGPQARTVSQLSSTGQEARGVRETTGQSRQ